MDEGAVRRRHRMALPAARAEEPKPPHRVFDTERYCFLKSAPEKWRRVWEEWSGENAVGQLMGTLKMYAERQLAPSCWLDEAGLLGLVMDVWCGEGIYGGMSRNTPERLRVAWNLAFHDDLPPDEELEAYLLEVRPAIEAHREAYFRERDAHQACRQRERLVEAVASGSYRGAATQVGLPGLE